jgi:hypothetical protein
VRARERTYEITDEGRAALAASKSTKLERIGWPVVWSASGNPTNGISAALV